MARSLGWAALLLVLTPLATSSGCGGQARSHAQATSRCATGEVLSTEGACVGTDAGAVPPIECGPGMISNGSLCIPTYGSGGATSTGGRSALAGATSIGGRGGSSGAILAGGAPSSGGAPSAGGRAAGGDAGIPDGNGTDADTTPPNFAGCKFIDEVSYESFRVAWDPAKDNGTGPLGIVYEIWVRPLGSTDPPTGVPTQTVVGSVGNVTIDGLLPGTDYEVLCSAKDWSGNRDTGQRWLTTRTRSDGSPPIFAGVATAAPGSFSGTVELTWMPAVDNAIDSSEIVYAVYVARAPGQEDFTKPLMLTNPGATSAAFSLPTRATYYFVVRARDHAGNEEHNATEFAVTLPTSFALDVQPIFNQSCAVMVCHTVGMDGTNPPIQGMQLDEGASYVNIVDNVAREGTLITPPEPNLKRVDASSTNPMDSYLWRKMQVPALSNIVGHSELGPQYGPPPTAAQIQIITDWITEGSHNN